MVAQPARVGWEAKKRRVDLTIERSFNGEELVKRMKGWVTTDPYKVIDVIKPYAKMKVLDDRELVLEAEKEEDLQRLNEALLAAFGGEVDVEVIQKRR
jgi:hypothetical protein